MVRAARGMPADQAGARSSIGGREIVLWAHVAADGVQRTNVVLRSPSLTQVQRGEVEEQVVAGTNHAVQTASAVASTSGSPPTLTAQFHFQEGSHTLSCFGNAVATYPGTETGADIQKLTLTMPLVPGQSTPLPQYDDGDGDKSTLTGSVLVTAGP